MTTSRPIRAFLIDDEPLALKRLARLLDATGLVEIVGRATDPERGYKQVAANEIDVLFLDIHMPGLSGFEVVERLPPGPLVVFTTAYDQHAVQAFEANAFDYLLKPIDPERLARVVERLRARRPARRTARRIPVVAAAGTELIDEQQVHYVQAEGDYSRVHTFDRSHLSTVSLRELETTLSPDRFVRIHRSYLVNVAKVASVRRAGPDRIRLVLDDAARTDLDVARRQSARVRAALKLGY